MENRTEALCLHTKYHKASKTDVLPLTLPYFSTYSYCTVLHISPLPDDDDDDDEHYLLLLSYCGSSHWIALQVDPNEHL